PRIDEVVLRALSKQESDRFADLDELVAAFEAALRPLPEERESERVERAARAAREQRQSAAVGYELSTILRRRLTRGEIVLPSLPTVAAECMRLLSSASCDLAEVARVAERDPLLVSRLLLLGNSSAYGGRNAVTTVLQAISRLGMRRIRLVVLEQGARGIFQSRDPRIRETFQKIWEHCIAVGTLSRAIAERVEDGPDPDEAYLAGLLHDAGKPIVAVYLLDTEHHLLEKMGPSWMGESVWLQVVEQAHREVGLSLVNRWQLPDTVRRALEAADGYVPRARASAGNIVRYANALARIEGVDAGVIDAHEAFEVAAEGRALFDLDEEVEVELAATLRASLEATRNPAPPPSRLR
ncbi:MAG: HDOD domain-containing protein, partial [Myxococcales bacterium]|nr:HDOD domain-containing protein [Myxococcales bacterium]